MSGTFKIYGKTAITVLGTALVFLVILAFVSTAEVDVPAEQADPPKDSIFMEIHVSSEGAFGITPDGEEWQYNFNTGKFERPEHPITTKKVYGVGPIEVPDIEFGELPEMPTVPDLQDISAEEVAHIEEEIRLIELRARDEALKARKIKGLKLGKVIVEEGETVRGPLVALGAIIVRGTVKGDVISYKRITVTSTGLITGDAVGPEIEIIRGGDIDGDQIVTDLQMPDMQIFYDEGSNVPIIVIISVLGGLLLLGAFFSAVLSKPTSRVTECISKTFVKSFFVGLIFWISLGPLVALLSMTVIGIPVAAIILPLAAFAGALLGIFGLAAIVGRKFSNLFGIIGRTQLGKITIGILILGIPWLLMAITMISSSSTSQGFSIFFMVIAIVTWAVVIITGVGSVILTRFGSRDSTTLSISIKIDKSPPPPTPPPLKSDET